MAEKRMFSKKIIDTDWFMDMPASTQNLYFHLSMRADDDGFVASPKRIIKLIGATDDDYRILTAKKFIIPFESGICVITDWRINNYLRNDRYNDTIYQAEKNLLKEDKNGKYYLGIPDGIPSVDPVLTYTNSNNNLNIINNKEEKEEEKHKFGEYGWVKLSNEQYSKLKTEFGDDYINKVIKAVDEYSQSNGNKNKYKDWNLVIRKAIREKWSILKEIEKEKSNGTRQEFGTII